MISYNKLFEYLKANGITKTDLANALRLSSATMAKLSKNETVSLQVIIDICNYLHCQPADIIENHDEIKKGSLLYILREEMNHKIKGGLYHNIQIQMAYNSNHIEGSTLSEDQTRAIYETNTIGLENSVSNVDDIIETVNHFRLFDYMLSQSDKPLTQKLIKEFHKILKTSTSDSRLEWFAVGDYKLKVNEVGGNETVAPENVEKEMQKLLLDYNNICTKKLSDLLDFHVRFEKIHPFQDGNGRVGRMILFMECLKYNIIPFIIYDNEKLFYYRGIREYSNDKTFLIETCLSFQDHFINTLKYFRINLET